MGRRSLLATALAGALAARSPAAPRPAKSAPRPVRHRYGTGPQQFGDLYMLRAGPPRGTVVVIHGGFWQSSYALGLRTGATVPLSQSRAYVDRARAAGDDARLVQVPGDHLALIDPSTWRRTVEALAGLTAAG